MHAVSDYDLLCKDLGACMCVACAMLSDCTIKLFGKMLRYCLMKTSRVLSNCIRCAHGIGTRIVQDW